MGPTAVAGWEDDDVDVDEAGAGELVTAPRDTQTPPNAISATTPTISATIARRGARFRG